MRAIFLDGQHEYNLESKGNTHTLYFSHSEAWCIDIRGTVALRIKDDGNGFKISKKFKRMDYSNAFELHILLKHIYKDYDIKEADYS